MPKTCRVIQNHTPKAPAAWPVLLALVLLPAGLWSTVRAQTSAASGTGASTVARQIVPMVAPIRRQPPSNTASLAPLLKRAAPPAMKPATSTVAAKPSFAVPVAASAVLAAPKAATTATTVAASVSSAKPAAAAPTAAPAAPKFAVYTCKLGEDYSVARKACFKPGVTVATGPEDRNARAKAAKVAAKAAKDTGTRSALGAKRKPVL